MIVVGIVLRRLSIGQAEVVETDWHKWCRLPPWHSQYVHLSIGIIHKCSARRDEVAHGRARVEERDSCGNARRAGDNLCLRSRVRYVLDPSRSWRRSLAWSESRYEDALEAHIWEVTM